MSQWQTYPLSELCEIRPPKGESKEQLKESESVSFVPMADLPIDEKYLVASQSKPLKKVYSGYTYFADEDVLLAKITPCFQNGKLSIAKDLTNGIGFGSSEFVVFRPCDELDNQFLYYFLSRTSFREEGVARMSGAVGHQRVPKEFIEDYPTPLPPLAEQKRIVSILDEAFSAIAKAKENAEKNLLAARELFESYLNRVFTQQGPGWQEKPLGDVVTFQGGSQPPKSTFIHELKPGYIRLIQIRDYKSDKKITFIPEEKARRKCDETDVMIGRYGPPLFQILRGIRGAYNVALMKAIPNEDLISKDYLYYFLKNRDLFNYIDASSSRTAGQTGFKKEVLEAYPIGYPTEPSEQTRIVSVLENMQAASKRLETIYTQKLANLDELRQSLLQKAFTGQLTSAVTEEVCQ